jgi:GR25 family glycosyltransferase involved in LPS biosynthesis
VLFYPAPKRADRFFFVIPGTSPMLHLAKISPLIAVIHSDEAERNAYLMPLAAELAENLGGYMEPIGTGLRKRPNALELVNKSFAEKQMYQNLQRKRAHKSSLTTTKQLLRSVYQTAKSLRHDLKPEKFKYYTIVYNLISKHYAAWEKLLSEPDDRVLIVFENDVRLKSASASDLSTLLAALTPHVKHDFIYCDLAGGVNPQVVLRGNLLHPMAWIDQIDLPPTSESASRHLAKVAKFVTNTTCGYLINKKLAEFAVDAFSKTGLVDADYFLNQILFEIDSSTDAITCYHAFPPMFEHGSATGVWQSTISDWTLCAK